jgi:hypothetical protein
VRIGSPKRQPRALGFSRDVDLALPGPLETPGPEQSEKLEHCMERGLGVHYRSAGKSKCKFQLLTLERILPWPT